MTNLFQRDEWLTEAAQAIRAVDPSAAPVVYAMRGYELQGRPSPLNARLEDGAQWVIAEGQARKLSESEIAENDRLRAVYNFDD